MYGDDRPFTRECTAVRNADVSGGTLKPAERVAVNPGAADETLQSGPDEPTWDLASLNGVIDLVEVTYE